MTTETKTQALEAEASGAACDTKEKRKEFTRKHDRLPAGATSE